MDLEKQKTLSLKERKRKRKWGDDDIHGGYILAHGVSRPFPCIFPTSFYADSRLL